MNPSTFAIAVLVLLFITLGNRSAAAAQTYPLFRRDANLHRFIRGLLRESYWKTDHPYETGNNGWIFNRQLVSGKEVSHERTYSIRHHG